MNKYTCINLYDLVSWIALPSRLLINTADDMCLWDFKASLYMSETNASLNNNKKKPAIPF